MIRTRRRSRHRTDTAAQIRDLIPPVLPLLVFEEHDQDQLLLTVNGNRAASQWIPRTALGHTITAYSRQFGTAIRVELHQRDGRIRADLIPPAPAPDHSQDPAATPASRPHTDPHPPAPAHGSSPQSPQLVEYRAGGFLAGESVTLSFAMLDTTADATGTARFLIDRAHPPQTVTQFIFHGTIFGTMHSQPAAAPPSTHLPS